ncbi:MAG TPA: hypothetical protein VGJ18_13765 [Gemmatimonadaceae bacterium]|jgi:hypothetical protein
MNMTRWQCRLAASLYLTALAAMAVSAQNETALAKASQNPVADLTTVPLQFNFNSGGGLESRTYLLLNVQPVMPLSLDRQWLLISRTIAPYVNVPMPDGTRQTGIADIQEQLYLTPKQPGRFIWGMGPIFSVPSATSDVVRTGQWALGPTAVGLVNYDRWVIGLLANNLWRIAGVDFGPPINQLTMQPFINFNIPLGWAITTSPLITSDWSAPEGQRWTVPLGLGFSKVTTIGRQAVNIAMQYYHNLEHPDNAAANQFRFQFNLLYPIERR